MLAIICGMLIDGTGKDPQKDVVLLVDNGMVKGICQKADFSTKSFAGSVLNAEGLAVIPGMINAHVHLSWTGEPAPQKRGEADETLLAFVNAQKTLSQGVTTVRDCGANTFAVNKLAQYIDKGILQGPRIIPSGQSLTITGGHGITTFYADGPDETRKATRQNIASGAKFIKIIATGGVLTPGTKTGVAQYSLDELAAIIYEAKRVGIKTAAHAIGTEGIKNCVLSGIDSIEHGSYLTEEIVEMMLQKNTYHVPTLSAYYQVVKNGTQAGIPQETVDKAVNAESSNTESFKMSYEKGVRFAAGTDAGTPYNFHGSIALELELMVQAGVPANEALMAATSYSADLLDIGDQVGTLEPGKFADFVLINGNPLEDIKCLSKVESVYRNGQKV